MEFLNNFINVYFLYTKELFFPISLGFFLSGLIYEFIPTKIVEKHFGQKGIIPILTSSLIGAILPLCCFGTLPIAVTMQQKGARLGPVLAFLVTTPATSVSALMACWKLLGPVFTVYIFVAVIVMGLVIGLLGNLFHAPSGNVENKNGNCCLQKFKSGDTHKGLTTKIEGALRYAFITLPKEIGLELLLGVAVASFVMVFKPAQLMIKEYLGGIYGYVFSLAVGLTTYVCSTASVPMADAFLKNGMSSGAAMVYLLVGPVTSYGTIFAVKKKFGWKVLWLYLIVICVLSVVFGVGYNMLVSNRAF